MQFTTARGLPSLSESVFLSQFLMDYLNRFEVYKMRFAFERDGYAFAGQTQNTNTIRVGREEVDLKPLLDKMGIPDYISLGGDFVVGYDYQALDEDHNVELNEVGLSLMDTSNHGYDAFFLAGHLRGLLLNVVDAHLRKYGQIQNTLFEELNDLMKGPVTQDLVGNTNPVRARRTKGAVGLYGQFDPVRGSFRFVDAGLPLLYYSSASDRFFYLQPRSAPPLGYFASHEAHGMPYFVQGVDLQPGDYLIMATDGCHETEEAEPFEDLPPVRKEILTFNYSTCSHDRIPHFNVNEFDEAGAEPFQDPGLETFCALLQPYVYHGADAEHVVTGVLEYLKEAPYFSFDDRSLIVVKAHPRR